MKGLSNHYMNQLSLYCLKDFSGVFPCDFLTEKKFRTNSKYIVNLDASDNPGSHFVAISVRGHNIFYFDSFALPCTNKYILQAVIESKKTIDLFHITHSIYYKYVLWLFLPKFSYIR